MIVFLKFILDILLSNLRSIVQSSFKKQSPYEHPPALKLKEFILFELISFLFPGIFLENRLLILFLEFCSSYLLLQTYNLPLLIIIFFKKLSKLIKFHNKIRFSFFKLLCSVNFFEKKFCLFLK